MNDINLLPWRSLLIKQQQKSLKTLITFCVLIIVVFFAGIQFFYRWQINDQTKQNRMLRQASAQVTQKIAQLKKFEKQKVVAGQRIKIIEQMQHDRFRVVNMLNIITHIIPKGMYLIQLSQNDKVIVVSGQATSNIIISKLIKEIDQNPNFAKPELAEVATINHKGISVIRFKLIFHLGSAA